MLVRDMIVTGTDGQGAADNIPLYRPRNFSMDMNMTNDQNRIAGSAFEARGQLYGYAMFSPVSETCIALVSTLRTHKTRKKLDEAHNELQ